MNNVNAMFEITLEPGAETLIPRKSHPDDAGFDIFASIPVDIEPGEVKLVPAGFRIKLDDGFEAQIRSRSGLARKNSVFVLNSPGTIDPGYRGEVGVLLHNAGKKVYSVEWGDRIAQMVINRFVKAGLSVKEDGPLEDTVRGDGGFGSTGR